MLELDDTDARMLGLLTGDARMTNRALADALAISESACSVRLQKLEASGVIAGYTTKIRYDRLGAFLAWTDVTLVNDDPPVVAAFERQLRQAPQLISAWCVSAAAQFRLLTATYDFEAWRAFCLELRRREDLVTRVSGTAVLAVYEPANGVAVARFRTLRGQ